MKYKLALIGFGNVGQGLAKILQDKANEIRDRHQLDIQIVAICDLFKGSVADPGGLNPKELLDHVKSHNTLENFPAPYKNWDVNQTISDSTANVLVELAFTDLKTGEPALTHLKQALKAGLNISTTNKGPIALHFPELLKLSAEFGGKIGVEGTVMSGTPAIHLGESALAGAGITRIQGVLNGTCNYILEQMENGTPFENALLSAQEKGFAEAEPAGDIEGHDSAAKVVILANLMMGQPMSLNDVMTQGIRSLTLEDIEKARESGKRWKLIGNVENRGGLVRAWVKPILLDETHPLFGISGVDNAITYSTDLLGDITLIGPGAGRVATGYAVLEDILRF